MNANELKQRFPNASPSFLAANSGEDPVLEHDPEPGTLAAGKVEKSDSGKFLVRVTSRRKRLIDVDNLCEKFHVDCCRYAGIIPSDAPECAHIEVRQEKVREGQPEETVIKIYEGKAE